MKNDISVVEMEKEVILGPRIGMVCLPMADVAIPNQQHLLVSGE
jgi:hypothetical protein